MPGLLPTSVHLPARRDLLITAAAGLLGGLAACAEARPLRIGFLGGLSGRVADLGLGGRNGAQLAVEDANAAGGGRAVELLTRDDEQNNDTARQRLAELFDAGVAFVVGPMTSSVAVAVVPLAGQRGVPLISPTAGTAELSGLDDAFFRVLPDPRVATLPQAAALLSRGRRRLLTMADLSNRPFSVGWNTAAAKAFTTGGGVVVESLEFEARPGLKFTELAARVADAALRQQADCFLLAASATDSALVLQHLRRLSPQLAFALSPWAGTEELPALGGRAVEGTLVVQFFDRQSRAPRYVDFAARFARRFGEAPGYPAVNAYDATQIGLALLRSTEPTQLLPALRQPREHDALQRRLSIDRFGDSSTPIFLAEIHDGRYLSVAS